MNRATSTLLAAFLATAACSDSSKDPASTTAGAGPLYGALTLTFTDTESKTYVSLMDSLDIAALDIKKAREFAQYSPTEPLGDSIYVASGESPVTTRFQMAADGTWVDKGNVSFANFMTKGGTQNRFMSPTRALVELEVTGHVVWNPSDLTVVGSANGPPEIPLDRGGLKISRGQMHLIRDNRLFQPYYWADATYDRYAPISQIGVYDGDTGKATAVLDAPCPHLHIASKDAEGNLYFSNGSLSGTAPLLKEDEPKNCVVRIKAGQETLDEAFTFRFADVTDGREGAGFYSVPGSNKAFFAVFHHERVEITPQSDPKKINYSANWRVWSMDLATRKAAPVEGLDYFAGQWTVDTIEGRTFLMLPAGDYRATSVYELLADGTVVKRFESSGWTVHLFKVR